MAEKQKEMLIYGAIEELLTYIDECKNVNFSGGATKRVDVDRINDLISAITVNIPEEIRRAQSIILEADEILDSAHSRAEELVRQANVSANGIRDRAKTEAERILEEAKLERDRMIDEHEVTIQAKAEAEQMIEATQKACCDTYEHAKVETGELLDEVERCLHNCVRAVHSERDRVGVRKMQTRYEPAEEENEEAEAEFVQEDFIEDETEQINRSTPRRPRNEEDYEEAVTEPVINNERRTENRRSQQEDRRQSRPRSPGEVIAGLAKKMFYSDDMNDGAFSEDESFDPDDTDGEF